MCASVCVCYVCMCVESVSYLSRLAEDDSCALAIGVHHQGSALSWTLQTV